MKRGPSDVMASSRFYIPLDTIMAETFFSETQATLSWISGFLFLSLLLNAFSFSVSEFNRRMINDCVTLF